MKATNMRREYQRLCFYNNKISLKLSFLLLLVLSCWKSYQYEGKTDQCGRSLVNRIYPPESFTRLKLATNS